MQAIYFFPSYFVQTFSSSRKRIFGMNLFSLHLHNGRYKSKMNLLAHKLKKSCDSSKSITVNPQWFWIIHSIETCDLTIFLEAEPLSTYLCLSACPPARPKFVGSKLYSPNLCLGKYNIGHGVNVVLCFVCSCNGQYPLVWTWTSGNAISASRTEGGTPPASALGDFCYTIEYFWEPWE